MNIIQDLSDRRIEALKNNDKPALKIYSYLLSVAQKVIKDGGDEDKIINEFRKERKSMMEVYDYARSDEERKTVTYEISVVDKYLPHQMSKDEIRVKVLQTAEEIHPISAKDKGKFMKAVMAKVKGRADGKLVNEVVTNYFNEIF